MSLDIYITKPDKEIILHQCPHCGHTHEYSSYPQIDWFNITHNLGRMAAAAGVYDCVWRPEEHGIEICQQMIKPLMKGLLKLTCYPNEFTQYNPENGCGSYDGFVEVLKKYLTICEDNPTAKIKVCR